MNGKTTGKRMSFIEAASRIGKKDVAAVPLQEIFKEYGIDCTGGGNDRQYIQTF